MFFLVQNMVMDIHLMAKMASWLMLLHLGQGLEGTPILMMMNCGLWARDKVPTHFNVSKHMNSRLLGLKWWPDITLNSVTEMI